MTSLTKPVPATLKRFYGVAFSFLLLAGLLTPAFAQKNTIKVADVTMPVAGTNYAADFESRNEGKKYPGLFYLYGFPEGDVVILNLKRRSGKASYNLEVRNYDSDELVYSKQNFTSLKDLRVTIPKKAIYRISVKSTHPESSEIRLQIARQPASPATRAFNPTVTWETRYDSVFVMKEEPVLASTDIKQHILADKTFQLPPRSKPGKPSRVVLPFKVPEKASHWVYWVGVGKESVKELEALGRTYSKDPSSPMAGLSPIAAFGQGLISTLPAEKASGYVDFLFMDQQAVKAFIDEGRRSPFPFASGDAVVNAYGKIMAAQTPKTADGTLYLGLENNEGPAMLDIAVKIIAFEAEPKFETRKVKRLSHLEDRRVPVLSE